ncbi:MAG: DUF4337 domain-containing protein [bacterium]
MVEIEIPSVEELEERAKSNFTKRVALFTAIFAVFLAITALGGNNASKEMMLTQQEVSNQWAFYQAKVIREQIYKTNVDNLKLQLMEKKKTLSPSVLAEYESIIRQDSETAIRYGEEKKEIEEKAKEKAKERDTYLAKDPFFDYAEVLLQIAIVLASISIVASSKRIFIFSSIAAIIGVLISINGFFLLIRF